MGILNLLRRNSFEHGIHPQQHKELTCRLSIRRLPFAPVLIVPLSQHAGAPAVPLVRPGQEVVRGEPVASANGFVSVPMHAPATGVVESIQLMPSHVKMKPPPEHKVDTLVVNGCECEPYLTCDHRLMLEQTDDLLAGIHIVMRALGVERAMIGIEDNKLDAVEVIARRLPANSPISVHAVQTKYPQGAEKMLIESLLGRRVPSGSFPSAVGVSVFNVSTLAQIGALLPMGQGVIERVVTVTGPGIRHPGNYLVPVGTPVRFLLEFAGSTPQAHELILGGPMMGMSVASLDVPVTKAVSGMVLLEASDADLRERKVQPCIRCAYCLEACPMHLNPSTLGLLAAKGDYETMADQFHLNDCFECGCCSYVCPSSIPLVQYFRIAKAINREKAA
jgi:electron transport complex protein RnfC